MESNNFRIGNILKDSLGRICRVEKIESDLVHCFAIEGPITSTPCQPIPLTEEILLKVGFEKEQNNLEIQFSNNFILTWNKKDGLGCGLEWKDYSLFQWGEIKYLHQLQNIYFALTGSELKTAGLI